jgi:hypothetical protein
VVAVVSSPHAEATALAAPVVAVVSSPHAEAPALAAQVVAVVPARTDATMGSVNGGLVAKKAAVKVVWERAAWEIRAIFRDSAASSSLFYTVLFSDGHVKHNVARSDIFLALEDRSVIAAGAWWTAKAVLYTAEDSYTILFDDEGTKTEVKTKDIRAEMADPKCQITRTYDPFLVKAKDAPPGPLMSDLDSHRPAQASDPKSHSTVADSAGGATEANGPLFGQPALPGYLTRPVRLEEVTEKTIADLKKRVADLEAERVLAEKSDAKRLYPDEEAVWKARLQKETARADGLQEQMTSEVNFSADAPWLRLQKAGMFDRISRKLLGAHRSMAVKIRDSGAAIIKLKLDWANDKGGHDVRPTQLVPALLAVLPPEFDASDLDDKSEAAQFSKSTAKCDFIWSEYHLHGVGSVPPKSASMEAMHAQVQVFAEDVNNPFMGTAKAASPWMQRAVAMLKAEPLFWGWGADNAIDYFDDMCEKIIAQSLLEPSLELLDSRLRSAFKAARDRYEERLGKVRTLSRELFKAKTRNDFTAIVTTEEAQIRATRLGLLEVNELLDLLTKPEYAERFLDGSTGKLASARLCMARLISNSRKILARSTNSIAADFLTLSELRTTACREIAFEDAATLKRKTAAVTRYLDLKAKIGAASDAPSWHWSDDQAQICELLACDREVAEAEIVLDKCEEARRLVRAVCGARGVVLKRLALLVAKCGELIDVVEKIVDIGLNGVETELRSRLASLAADKMSLLADLRELFALRYSLLAARESALRIRLAKIARNRKELSFKMEEAAAALEVALHAELAEKLAAEDRNDMSTRTELDATSADLTRMDADQTAERAFAEAKVDHPRIAATAAQHALIKSKSALTATHENIVQAQTALLAGKNSQAGLADLMQQLSGLGLDPTAVFLEGLKQLAGPPRRPPRPSQGEEISGPKLLVSPRDSTDDHKQLIMANVEPIAASACANMCACGDPFGPACRITGAKTGPPQSTSGPSHRLSDMSPLSEIVASAAAAAGHAAVGSPSLPESRLDASMPTGGAAAAAAGAAGAGVVQPAPTTPVARPPRTPSCPPSPPTDWELVPASIA